MAIRLNERHSDASRFFVSPHFIAYALGGGRATIVRSGIVRLPNETGGPPEGVKGASQSKWRNEEVVLFLDLSPSIARLNPQPPADEGKHWAFDMDQWAPIAGLNTIYNEGVSNNAGSSVTTFKVRQDNPPLNYR